MGTTIADFSPDLRNDLETPSMAAWYHIEKGGKHEVDYGSGNRLLDISPAAIDEMVKEFNSRDFEGLPGLLIDCDHLSHDPAQDTRALGWVRKLARYDDPDTGTAELYGWVEWTPRGHDMLVAREYCQSSTEYDDVSETDTTITPHKLAGFALTNRPRIKGKRPLTNRANSSSTKDLQEQQQPHKNTMESDTKSNDPNLLDSICQRLGCANGDELMARLNKLLELEKDAAAKEEAVKAEAAEEILEDSEASEEEKAAVANSLSNEIARNAILKSIRNAREKQKATVVNRIEPQESLLNRVKTKVKPAPTGESQKESHAIKNRAEELMREKGLSWGDAFARATLES